MKRDFSQKDWKANRYGLEKLVFFMPLLILLYFALLKILANDAYQFLIQEDGVVEYMQCLAYFIASLFAFIVACRFFRTKKSIYGALYMILALGLFFVSMEEISWGQRIFGIDNPFYFSRHNLQGELNVHNLESAQPYLEWLYIVVGGTGAFLWIFAERRMKPGSVLRYFIPAKTFMLYFLPTFLLYLYYQAASRWIEGGFFQIGYFFVPKDQEIAELLLSFGFLLFVGFRVDRRNK